MKAGIIGGTGFVGSYIVEALQKEGHDVSLLVRNGSEGKIPAGSSIETTSGGVTGQDALIKVLDGCDVAIYCVGLLREFPRKGITFESTQYEGVVRAVEAAIQNNVGRFVLISANGVKNPGTRYQETKRRAEEVVLGSGLDATIFRPSVIFGDPHGRMEFATQLYRDMVDKPIPAVAFFSGARFAEGQVRMSPVHVEDVAQAVCASVARSTMSGRTVVLGGPEVLTWSEMLRRIAAATGRTKWIVPFPISLMKVAAAFLDRLPFFPVTRDQLTMLAEGNTADSKELVELIGRPARPFSQENLAYLAG